LKIFRIKGPPNIFPLIFYFFFGNNKKKPLILVFFEEKKFQIQRTGNFHEITGKEPGSLIQTRLSDRFLEFWRTTVLYISEVSSQILVDCGYISFEKPHLTTAGYHLPFLTATQHLSFGSLGINFENPPKKDEEKRQPKPQKIK
jgi:hypothetical protein